METHDYKAEPALDMIAQTVQHVRSVCVDPGATEATSVNGELDARPERS
jgi:hypothetical protein